MVLLQGVPCTEEDRNTNSYKQKTKHTENEMNTISASPIYNVHKSKLTFMYREYNISIVAFLLPFRRIDLKIENTTVRGGGEKGRREKGGG